jgi:hypothetical protein
MKPGDLVQYTLRRRNSTVPYPIGILLEIRPKEYPLSREREHDYIVLIGGEIWTLTRRNLRLLEETR